MNLTAHFTLAELTASEYAIRHGLANTPSDLHILGNLHILAAGLERCREYLGKPIIVTSGYRSPEVNAGIGGSKTSAHMKGLAADIRVPGMSPREVCVSLQRAADTIQFDQLIYEGTWTHIAFPEDSNTPRLQTLTAVFAPGKVTYVTGIV